MDSMTRGQTSSTIPDPPSSPRWKFDVFLSFRGEDTRGNFTNQLYLALCRKGIVTFRDNEELKKGKAISPELLNAIEKSRISVAILSTNYASSAWCLDELAKIVECMEESGSVVLPVFYGVDPSEVRYQHKGNFQKHFAKHQQRQQREKVDKWRKALTQVANLSGWESKVG